MPGHTWGHLVYLIDNAYLFLGDTIWLGYDGGYSFINALAENNKLAIRSLAALKAKLEERNVRPMFITGHTGYSRDFDFVFRHTDKACNAFCKQKPVNPAAPYDSYDESDDTEEDAQGGFLPEAAQYGGKQ